MSDREPSLQELLVASFNSQMNNMYTAIPCVVLAIRDNLEGQEVDIQPSINQRLRDGTTKERPAILGVPVSFQVSSTAGFTFPINVGDTGLAIFSMRNMDAWKSGSGRPTTPLNFAVMDKGDAIFLPGIQPPSVAVNNPSKRMWSHSTSDAVLVNNIGTGQEVEVRLKANGNVVINTQQDVEVNCETATVNANSSIELNATSMTVDVANTTWIGNITMTGTYILDSVNMNLHTHPILSGSSAPGPTGGPQ